MKISGAEAKFAFSYASRGAVAEISLSNLVTHIASPVGQLALHQIFSFPESFSRSGTVSTAPVRSVIFMSCFFSA